MKKIEEFISGEEGAISVDWVVLTAAIVGFGAVIALYFQEPVEELDARTGAALSGMNVVDPNFQVSKN